MFHFSHHSQSTRSWNSFLPIFSVGQTIYKRNYFCRMILNSSQRTLTHVRNSLTAQCSPLLFTFVDEKIAFVLSSSILQWIISLIWSSLDTGNNGRHHSLVRALYGISSHSLMWICEYVIPDKSSRSDSVRQPIVVANTRYRCHSIRPSLQIFHTYCSLSFQATHE